MNDYQKIFNIGSSAEFDQLALETFRYQAARNEVYREWLNSMRIDPATITAVGRIPFLPISLFKNRDVTSSQAPPQGIFLSSGTTSGERSRHLVADLRLYRMSFVNGFRFFFGDPEKFQFLALVPAPDQATDSSLVYMIRHLMDLSTSPENGFFLANYAGLKARLLQKRPQGHKIMVIGLAYALLDFAEQHPGDYSGLIVVETGGMKGRRQEMIRKELHERLNALMGVEKIHSEYGMTELLSQAWSVGSGLFRTPPWMRIVIREVNDPFSQAREGDAGGINVIDLANLHSCSFIATQDLGRKYGDGTFEVIGRFDGAEARGCSLMI